MSRLEIHWEAKFSDGIVIKQYDCKGKEHKFKEVLDKKNDLTYFILRHINKNRIYIADLKKGIIYLDATQIPEADVLPYKGKYRLIYFRRVTINFDGNLKKLDEDIKYFLGFQWNDNEGKNIKKVIQINSNGDVVI